MKKVFSFLFVAMLAMSAWADITVTFIPGTTGGQYTGANQYDEMTLDGVTISGTKSALAANPYRFAAGSTATISSTVGNIKRVEFTCQGSYSQSYGPDQFYGDGYTCQSGSRVGVWQGDAASFTLNTASQVRCNQIVVTIAEEVVEDLVPPVFNPDGGEFTGSLEVTLSCATENASIFWFYGTEEDQGEHHYYNGPIYLTETNTLTAYSLKGDEISDYVTVTFTKVEQTVEAPVFSPASCYFEDPFEVTISCATPGATIYYSLDQDGWTTFSTPIPVTDNLTIWAEAVVGDVHSEMVSATYTKLPDNTVKVTFDASFDTGDGSLDRGEYTIEKDGVTMYVGDGTVYPDHYRIYTGENSALTFTSSTTPIIKIEFEGVSGNPASNLKLAEGCEGTFTASDPDGVWEGLSQEVAFEVTKQARFYSITVTLAPEETPEYQLGDVNHDGNVDIADVTDLIDYILFDVTLAPAEADFNQDGVVGIADVTDLIDYLLSQSHGE